MSVGPVRWQVLWPARVIDEESVPNNASLVLLVRSHGLRLLLTGDVEPPAQRALLARGRPAGGRRAQGGPPRLGPPGPRLLAAVRPRVARDQRRRGQRLRPSGTQPPCGRCAAPACSSGAPTPTAPWSWWARRTGSGSSGPAGSVTAMPAAPGPAPLTLVTGPEALLRDRAVATAVAAVRGRRPGDRGQRPVRRRARAGTAHRPGQPVAVRRRDGDRRPRRGRGRRGRSPTSSRACWPRRSRTSVLVLVHPGGTKGKSLLDAARKAGAVVVECKAVKWESDKVSFVQGEFKAAGRRVRAGRRGRPRRRGGQRPARAAPAPAPARRRHRRAPSTGRWSSATTPAASR